MGGLREDEGLVVGNVRNNFRVCSERGRGGVGDFERVEQVERFGVFGTSKIILGKPHVGYKKFNTIRVEKKG